MKRLGESAVRVQGRKQAKAMSALEKKVGYVSRARDGMEGDQGSMTTL